MFEKEIKFIADFSLNKIKNLGSFFTFEKLQSTDIHPSIIQYISAELDFLIYEDRRKLLQQSVFDYSGKEINKYFDAISEELKKTKRISYEDIKKLVIQAVSFNINFIARPRWSLSKLVYNNEESKPVDEIRLMFNYLYYYDYVKSIFLVYINKRKMVSLSLVDFELIMNKMDKEIFVPEQTKKLVDNAVYSMADFFNIGSAVKTKIPSSPLEIFLREKNLIDSLFRLKRSLPPDTRGKYEVEELRKVIYSTDPAEQQKILVPEKEPEETPPVEPEKPIERERFSSIHKKAADEESVSEDISDDPEEKDVDYFQDMEIEIPQPEPEFEEDDKSISDLNVPEKMPEIEEDSTLEEEPLPGFEELEEDDELLRMYDEELKEFEKESGVITNDNEEIDFDITAKGHLDDLYDFEDVNTEKVKKEAEKDSPGFDEAVKEELETSEEYELTDEINIPEEKDDDVEDAFRELEMPDEYFDVEEKPKEKEAKKDRVEKKAMPNNFPKDVFSFLSNKDMDRIVSNIFNEDRDDFATTMEKISECTTYDEATEILKGVFFSYRVNPYSKDAVTLTNAVSNYFNQA